MKATYLHRFIAQHLQSTCRQLHNWPFNSVAEIEAELCRQQVDLDDGDYLVVAISQSGTRLGKVRELKGAAEFPSNSLVISYHELERAFHEQHADYVEL